MKKCSIAPQRGFFPQPAYLIGAYKEDGNANFALITWVTFCSVNPPTFMFASRGKKLTRELVEKNKMFSANLVTVDMMNMADYFGINSGFERDKCSEVDAKYYKGDILNVPILEASPWVFECKLNEIIPEGEGYIYIGEVKNIQVSEAIEDTAYGKIDLMQINPLIYAPGKYYSLKEAVGNVGGSRNL